jgi:hypothetical protein
MLVEGTGEALFEKTGRKVSKNVFYECIGTTVVGMFNLTAKYLKWRKMWTYGDKTAPRISKILLSAF